jgi:hypothetical protein
MPLGPGGGGRVLRNLIPRKQGRNGKTPHQLMKDMRPILLAVPAVLGRGLRCCLARGRQTQKSKFA